MNTSLEPSLVSFRSAFLNEPYVCRLFVIVTGYGPFFIVYLSLSYIINSSVFFEH